MPLELWTDSRLKRMLERCERIIFVIENRRICHIPISPRIQGLYYRASNSRQWVSEEIEHRKDIQEWNRIEMEKQKKRKKRKKLNPEERKRRALAKVALKDIRKWKKIESRERKSTLTAFNSFSCDNCFNVKSLEFCRIKRNVETHAPEGLYCCDCFYTQVDAWHLTDSPYRKIGRRKPVRTSDPPNLEEWFICEMRGRDSRYGWGFKRPESFYPRLRN